MSATFAGFGALAFAMHRHHRAIRHREPGHALKWGLRAAGVAFLALAFGACVAHWGWAIGPVAWFGVLSATALGFAIALAFVPRVAASLAAVAGPVSAILALVCFNRGT